LTFCIEHMTEALRESIARSLFVVKEGPTSKGELHGLCPAHEDRNKPSYSYNIKTDKGNCLACGFHGDLVELWCHVNGHVRDQGGFKAFCQAFDIKKDSESTSSPKPVKKAANKPVPVDSPPFDIDEPPHPAAAATEPKAEQASDADNLLPIPWEQFDALPALPEEWIERLIAERGWSRDVIEKMRLRLYIHTKDRAKLFQVRMTFGQRRVAIPIPDDAGNLVNVRFYLPWDRTEADAKICSINKRGEARLFPPPSQWGTGPLWQVEGEPDVICALSQGLNAVTKTIGALTWKDEWNEYFAGREVINCYDCDKVGLAGTEKVGQKLAPVAKLFRWLRWPALMYDSTTYPLDDPKQKFSEFVKSDGALWPANHGEDLTDFIVKRGLNVADLKELLATAGTFAAPEKKPEIDLGLRRFFKGRKFMPALLAKAIMQDIEIVSDPMTGLVYRWEGRYWEQYDLQYIRNKALQMLDVEGNSSKASDVSTMIRDLSVLPAGRKLNNHEDLICLESGMFNLRTGTLLPHSKEYYATYMLPIKFDPKNVPDCPTWKRCLEQWMSDPAAILESQKFAGYCLTRETRYEKMLILYGPGGDGKSKWMNTIKALVGEDNVSHIPMGRLEDQFYMSRLVDKLVNMSTEIESKAMQSMEMKAIVSGDSVCASFKNQTPFDFTPFCKLIYSTNKLPKMLDNSDGFFRKIMIIKFEGQFVKKGEADLFLQEKLLEELPGIFAWALMGLVKLRDQGFTAASSMNETLAMYKMINNNVLYYIDRHIEADGSAKVIKSTLYDDYSKRVRGYNLQPMGEPTFRAEFLRQMKERGIDVRDGKESVVVDHQSGATERRNAYVGFRVVEEKAESDPEALPPFPLPTAGNYPGDNLQGTFG
jgi:putative DNA primase/helicase